MEDDNVIYVQVDEQGRVVSYTSNTNLSQQLILLQEDGQSNQVITKPAPTNSTLIVPMESTPSAVNPVISPTPPSKPTVIDLGSLPSGIKFIGASTSTANYQAGSKVVIPGGNSPKSHVVTGTKIHGIAGTPKFGSPQQIINICSKTLTNPATLTLSPQKISLAQVSRTNSSGMQIIHPSNKLQTTGNNSVISSSNSNVASLSLVETIGSLSQLQRNLPEPEIEQISLDQLVSSGAVTLQRIKPQEGNQAAVNSTTGSESASGFATVSADDFLTKTNGDIMDTGDEGVAYANPDTTTGDPMQMENNGTVTPEEINSEEIPEYTYSQGNYEENDVPATGKKEKHISVLITDNFPPQLAVEERDEAGKLTSPAKLIPVPTTSKPTDTSTKHSTEIGKPSAGRDYDTGDDASKMSDDVMPYGSDAEEEEDDEFDMDLPKGLIRGEPIAREKKVEAVKEEDDSVAHGDTVEEGATIRVSDDQEYVIEKVCGSDSDKSEDEQEEERAMEVDKTHSKREDAVEKVKEKVHNTDHNPDDFVPPLSSRSPRKSHRLPLARQTSGSEDDTEKSGSESDASSSPPSSLASESKHEQPEQQHASPRHSPAPASPQQRGKPVTSPEEPEVSEKTDFMKKNFGLFTPREIEEKKNKRRSSRITNAEKQAEAKQITDENELSKPTGVEATSTSKPSDGAQGDGARTNIFDMFGQAGDTAADQDDSQRQLSKLQSVNAELRGCVRDLEQRLATASGTTSAKKKSAAKEVARVRKLEAQLAQARRFNEELVQRVTDLEAAAGKGGSPGEGGRKVDMTLHKHGQFSFSTPGASKKDSTSVESLSLTSPGRKSLSGAGGSGAVVHSVAQLERKEQKLRTLHNELDLRTSQLRARESRLQRLVGELKEREHKVAYKEQALSRRVQDIEYRERMLEGKTKAAIEKRNKQGGAGAAASEDADDIRSAELARFEMEQRLRELERREREVRDKEQLLKVTEIELQEFHMEMRQEYEKNHNPDSTKQVRSDPFGAPHTSYLGKIGATPVSSRSSRFFRRSKGSEIKGQTPKSGSEPTDHTTPKSESSVPKGATPKSSRVQGAVNRKTPVSEPRTKARGAKVTTRTRRSLVDSEASKETEAKTPTDTAKHGGRPRRSRQDRDISRASSRDSTARGARRESRRSMTPSVHASQGDSTGEAVQEVVQEGTPVGVTRRSRQDRDISRASSRDSTARGARRESRRSMTPSVHASQGDSTGEAVQEVVQEGTPVGVTRRSRQDRDISRASSRDSTARGARRESRRSMTPSVHASQGDSTGEAVQEVVQEVVQEGTPVGVVSVEGKSAAGGRGRGRMRTKQKVTQRAASEAPSERSIESRCSVGRPRTSLPGESDNSIDVTPRVVTKASKRTPLSATRAQQLKQQALKHTRKSRGGATPVTSTRKRSRSSSASSAPSDGKRKKQM